MVKKRWIVQRFCTSAPGTNREGPLQPIKQQGLKDLQSTALSDTTAQVIQIYL